MGKWEKNIGAPAAIFGTLVAGALVETTVNKHRIRTHKSLKGKPGVDTALTILGAPYADTDTWAQVHRVHHSTPDANLYPFVRLADYKDWRDANPGEHADIDYPDFVESYDPAAEKIELERALFVGELARKLVEGKYEPQGRYSESDGRDILHGTDRKYLYKPYLEGKPMRSLEGPLILEDLQPVLRDAHSPVLTPTTEIDVLGRTFRVPGGVPGILFHNRHRYDEVDGRIRHNPELGNRDIVTTRHEQTIFEHKNLIRQLSVAGSAAALIALTRPGSTKGKLARGAEGAAVFGLAAKGLILGGNLTNSLGHAGDLSPAPGETWRDNVKEIMSGRVRPMPDGTYMTRKKDAGIVASLVYDVASGMSLDEVGGQKTHHDHPGYVAYTEETGIRGFRETPFGAVLKIMADKGILFEVGDGFDGRRPDTPSDAVLALEAIRRDYMAQHPEKY